VTAVSDAKDEAQHPYAGLPEDVIPLEFAVVVKCIDGNGDLCVCYQRSEGLNPWEALGMLMVFADDIRAAMRIPYEDA
jgi:hypothetical protein